MFIQHPNFLTAEKFYLNLSEFCVLYYASHPLLQDDGIPRVDDQVDYGVIVQLRIPYYGIQRALVVSADGLGLHAHGATYLDMPGLPAA